jgi:hypothetical protein
MSGFQVAGFMVNHMDIAPRFAGTLFGQTIVTIPHFPLLLWIEDIHKYSIFLCISGVTNTIATIPGMIAPFVASAMTPNVRIGQSNEWLFILHHSEHTVGVVESVLGVRRHFMLWCCLLRDIWFRRTAGMGCD